MRAKLKLPFIVLLISLAINIYPEEIITTDHTFVYRINDENDVQIVFGIIKTWIERNNYYSCVIRSREVINKDANFLVISKPFVIQNGVTDSTLYICYFYLNGIRIDLSLSDNEVLGLTYPYSIDERDQVFERFHQLYRWNILGLKD